MGMDVHTTINPAVLVEAATVRRRALLAGGEVLLRIAQAGAPKRSGDLIASGRVEFDRSSEGLDGVAVIFGEYYAQWQEEKDYYHHLTGHAHFLELAVVGGHEEALGVVATEMRGAFG